MVDRETGVIVVGDGPGGLQAALLLAKDGMDVDVVGRDETPMHKAFLHNYLGIEGIHGSEFMDVARDQVDGFGARLQEAEIVEVEPSSGAFEATTDDGTTLRAPYLVLATGMARDLGEDLDLDYDGDVLEADRDAETSRENVYAVGWAARAQKIQATISVGDGAAAALDILSKEKGEPYHDFDTP